MVGLGLPQQGHKPSDYEILPRDTVQAALVEGNLSRIGLLVCVGTETFPVQNSCQDVSYGILGNILQECCFYN